jgi:hypothetical protein
VVPEVDEHVSSAEKPKRTSVKKTATAAPEIIPTEMPEYDPEEEILPPVLPDPAMVESVAKQKVTAKDAEESAALVAAEIAQAAEDPKPVYVYPSIDLLKLPGRGAADGTAEMRENSRRLNETLASFKIEANILIGIAYILNGFSNDSLNVKFCGGSNFTHYVNRIGGAKGFTRNTRHRVRCKYSIKNRIGNFIANLVGMSLGYRLRGKKNFLFHNFLHFIF